MNKPWIVRDAYSLVCDEKRNGVVTKSWNAILLVFEDGKVIGKTDSNELILASDISTNDFRFNKLIGSRGITFFYEHFGDNNDGDIVLHEGKKEFLVGSFAYQLANHRISLDEMLMIRDFYVKQIKYMQSEKDLIKLGLVSSYIHTPSEKGTILYG